MLADYVDDLIEQFPALDEGGSALKQKLHGAVLDGGESARRAVDVLHGTWLGHPLHPLLTDVTIGAWSLGAIFDAVAAATGSRDAQRTADRLTAIGTTAALPTAMTGLADYSTISQSAVPVGLLHGLLNHTAFGLYVLSLRERKGGHRGRGITFSALGFGVLTAAAWIGGHLVYRYRIGVNHAESISAPQQWTPILAESEIAEGEPERVEVAGKPVLLYRESHSVYAISAVCSHAGGPLEEGQFQDLCVRCPWHDSVFDLRDGRIVHGPATFPQPSYLARIHDGQVEVRVRGT